ncbi:hypothetical protein C0J52_16099 [Blattella germanica]|nr:hypothetical protein C0J52_16099 [Blattella germanica]
MLKKLLLRPVIMYDCKCWPLTKGEENRVRSFERNIGLLRKILYMDVWLRHLYRLDESEIVREGTFNRVEGRRSYKMER